MQLDLYYFNDKIFQTCQDPKFQALLERVCTGSCTLGDNLECLYKGEIELWCVRTTIKERILFMYNTDQNNAKVAITVWQYLDDHNYNPVIKSFKSSQSLRKIKTVEPSTKEKIKESVEKEAVLTPKKYLEFQDESLLSNYFILDKKQTETVDKPLPMLLEGGPGSGKTTIHMTVLEKKVELWSKCSFYQYKKILFITKSKQLVNEVKSEWEQSPRYKGNEKIVEVLTYEEFLEKILKNSGLKLNEDTEKFKNWFHSKVQKVASKKENLSFFDFKLKKICKENIGNNKLLKIAYKEFYDEFYSDIFSEWFRENISNGKSVSTFVAKNPKLVYEEFRIASGYDNKISYVKSGEKQSSLNSKTRNELFEYYLQWQSYLEKNCLKNSDFFDLRPYLKNIVNDEYGMMLIDEGQDLSHLQLKILVTALANNEFLISNDDKQNLSDSNPKSIYLKSIINQYCRPLNSSPIEPVILPKGYRAPGRVMKLAKVFNDLRCQLSPVTKQEAIFNLPEDNAGKIFLIDPKSKLEEDLVALALWKEKVKNVDTYVITQEDKIEEARKFFPDAINIVTPKDRKGLSCKRILLFNILSDDLIYEINGFLRQNEFTTKDSKYATLLSKIFVAITRAEGKDAEVCIFQEDKNGHKLKYIVSKLEVVNIVPESANNKHEEQKIEVSGIEDLKKHAQNLYKQGFEQDAYDVLLKHVFMTEDQVGEFLLEGKKVLLNKNEKFLENKKETQTDNGNLVSLKNKNAQKQKKIAKKKQKEQFEKILKADDNIPLIGLIKGFDINFKKDGCTLFATFCKNKQIKRVAECLVIKGIDVNVKDEDGYTPFITAVMCGHVEIIDLLLKNDRIDVNYQFKDSGSAILFAIMNGSSEIVGLLLDNPCLDVNLARLSNGNTPLMTAITYYNPCENCEACKTTVRKLCNSSLVKLFLDNPRVDLNIKNKEGYSPLNFALSLKKLEIADVLLNIPTVIIEDMPSNVPSVDVNLETKHVPFMDAQKQFNQNSATEEKVVEKKIHNGTNSSLFAWENMVVKLKYGEDDDRDVDVTEPSSNLRPYTLFMDAQKQSSQVPKAEETVVAKKIYNNQQ